MHVQLNVDLYMVYDTIERKFWQTPKGKRVWNKPGPAKNAFNMHYGSYGEAFDSQSRYVVAKVINTELDILPPTK